MPGMPGMRKVRWQIVGLIAIIALLILYIQKQEGFQSTSSVLILYCYKEDAESKKNIEYFLKKGITDDPVVQYRFLVNAGRDTVTFPEQPNVRVIRRKEDEYDLLTYKWYFKQSGESADSVIWINSSCKGPIGITGRDWIRVIEEYLRMKDIVGPVVEFHREGSPPFLHSYMLAMNRRGFEEIRSHLESFSSTSMSDVITLERVLTERAIERGLRVGTFLKRFREVNLSDPSNWSLKKWGIDPEKTDFERPGNYYGGDLDPNEIIFFKNIRRAHAHRAPHMAGISDTVKAFLDSLN
jgi:hypothetical protein